MLRRTIRLRHGLNIGDETATTAVIREDGPGDEMAALNAGLTGEAATMFIQLRQVAQLGSIENPAQELLLRLRSADWFLITRGIHALNAEILADLKQSGLLDEGSGGGREEPGGSPPGTA